MNGRCSICPATWKQLSDDEFISKIVSTCALTATPVQQRREANNMPTAEYIETVENSDAESIVGGPRPRSSREFGLPNVQLSGRRHDRARSAAETFAAGPGRFPRDRLPLRRHLPIPRQDLTEEWRLNLVNALPRQTVKQQESEFGLLYAIDPAKCCQLRKVEPLMASLEPFEIWLRASSRAIAHKKKSEKDRHHRLPERKTLLKVSPSPIGHGRKCGNTPASTS